MSVSEARLPSLRDKLETPKEEITQVAPKKEKSKVEKIIRKLGNKKNGK